MIQNLKNKLTDYLNSIPDNPPVSSYSCVNGKSLLDWKLAKTGEYNIARVVGVFVYKIPYRRARAWPSGCSAFRPSASGDQRYLAYNWSLCNGPVEYLRIYLK